MFFKQRCLLFFTVFALTTLLKPVWAQYRQEYPLPTPSIPDSLGVNIHFTDPAPNRLDLLAAAGFKWIRMDFSWSDTEHERGVYNFSDYDRLMAGLRRAHIRALFILDYGNDLYQHGAPTTPEARAAFCKWVAAAVTHFRHQGILWEMWNEPNIGFWQPHPDVNQYADLALAVGQTIRRVAPDEWYIGPGMSGMDFGFLEGCFKRGLLQYWDAVSFHPYRDAAPETAAPDFERVRQLIRQYAPPGKSVPILASEWGYSELYQGLDLEKQSRYIVREFLSNIANGLLLTIWYDWHDDGLDPHNAEHHFGTVFNNYQPKSTYLAAQTLARTLDGFVFRKRLDLSSPNDYCLLFTRGNEARLAVWTTEALPHPVQIPQLTGKVEVIGLTGARFVMTAEGNGLRFYLTNEPQYLVPTHNTAQNFGAE
ncbi:MAG TPA: cellulase family glycosylhydrolase [Chthonomonas sp.]|uniref:cellulase family glycosylhydrolase n=1 Tax=Chthonomonas sp. TaxID=2282153 RepID=UPI002B4B137C|nr:cellulase family glycosylhydrolase [Chthonomonas sp.]HLI47515.1 cellulase family glycosylhydrolase [Chthonomonas sp.]